MQVGQAASLIKKADYAIALTGAGISTPSGIPDFRSSDNGLWTKYDPMQVASLSAFRFNPEKFFDWFRPLTQLILDAEPNPAHYSLADLESIGLLKSVITQNIDGLHQKAGTEEILEIHGTMKTLTCVGCYTRFPAHEYIKPYLNQGEMPRCNGCGSVLKPDAILFGEQLPQHIWAKAKNEVAQSDLMIVVGSSLEVVPVAKLPYEIISNGGKLIIINNQETYLDSKATLVFHQDAAVILPLISERLGNA
jgi:NAD-dependent deacetylase